jgi:short-subunit dehydrogenase involved in D-alanine esterification of teichoic acids
MTPKLNGEAPRVLIAGGGGGVGLACAEALDAFGAELILCDIDGLGLTHAGERTEAFTRYCDAVDDNSVAIFAAEIAQKFPSIDVLINAAGRGYVRSLAMMRMTRAFMPMLRGACGRRLLINIAPAGGFISTTGMFPYASSHRSFHGLAEAIKEQARGTSINVINVTPRLLRAWHDDNSLYELQCVDEQHTAERVVTLIEHARGAPLRRRPPNCGNASWRA